MLLTEQERTWLARWAEQERTTMSEAARRRIFAVSTDSTNGEQFESLRESP